MSARPYHARLPGARALATVAVVLLALPIVGLISRIPADTLARLGDPAVLEALGLSLAISVAATVLAALVGLPVAWALARIDFRGRALVRGLVMLPMVLPPVVGGVALLTVFGRRGLFGGLELDFAFTTLAAVVAAAFVSAPFLIVTVEGALRQVDPRLEAAAASLGATPWATARTVIFPQARPGLVAGLALTWARALGEFGATITFAGSVPGRTQTLPIAVYQAFQSDYDAAITMAILLLVVAVAILIALRGRWLPA